MKNGRSASPSLLPAAACANCSPGDRNERKERKKMGQLDPPRVVAVVVVGGGGARDGANTDNLL